MCATEHTVYPFPRCRESLAGMRMTTLEGHAAGADVPPIAPDLRALTDRDLEDLFARICSAFGTVD
jgi:hypothetical protein